MAWALMGFMALRSWGCRQGASSARHLTQMLPSSGFGTFHLLRS